jgi:hypothetical protein
VAIVAHPIEKMIRHYLDEDSGDLPIDVPERILSLAVFFGAIVAG